MNKIDRIFIILNKMKKIDDQESKELENEREKDFSFMNTEAYLKMRDRYREMTKAEERKLKDMGIEFACTDYGDTHCLDTRGLKMVLNAIKNRRIKK